VAGEGDEPHLLPHGYQVRFVSFASDSSASAPVALEPLAKETNRTWYPWGDSVMVVRKVEQVRNQHGETVTSGFNRARVDEVLKELSRASGVEFQIEPGAIQRVPPEYRRINLTLDDYPIRDALERIKGVTGLDYVVTPNGVYIQNANATSAGAVSGATVTT